MRAVILGFVKRVPMFDDQAFQSWPLILAGATVFAGLFSALALMSELLFEGQFQVTSLVVGFGVTAFVGYVGTALILRQGRTPPNG